MSKNSKNRTIAKDNIVNIKVENKEQIISSYSYDENDKLNKDLAEFIITKTKRN